MNMVVGGGDETFKQGVWFVGFALKFGVELARNEERVIFQFDHFDQLAVRRQPAENEPGALKLLAIGIVELVAVAMPFVDDKCAVEVRRHRSHFQLAGLRSQTHRPTFL